MKTAMQQMIKEIDNQQKRYIDLAKKDKKLSKGVDAILTATTLLKMRTKELLEAEKEQIINAYSEGMAEGIIFETYDNVKPETPEEYYLQTFKKE